MVCVCCVVGVVGVEFFLVSVCFCGWFGDGRGKILKGCCD